ncbi:cardiolipin synthase [Sulfurovum sp. CS9]|uniref:cardiolipin synthase n=1 Tax=Sulfurovum sp. CS9 TaxID=3391146 RepID=UPI0039E76390
MSIIKKESPIETTAIHWFYVYLIVTIGGVLLFSAIAHILYQKRSPTSMISWMLAIIFMPFLTVPLYFLIGIRKRENTYTKASVQLHEAHQENIHIDIAPNNALSSILEKNGIPSATKGNRYELITKDTEAYARLMDEIEKATESIDLGTYVFSYDVTTQKILEALTKRASEGIRVRLLLDVVGSLGSYLWQKNFQALRDAGGEVGFFIPIMSRPFQSYINLRNHRKIYLFDKKRLLSGGMNLSDEYLGEESSTKRWDDILYYLEGPAVFGFYQIFHNDWNYAMGLTDQLKLPIEPVESTGESTVQVVPSGPDIPTDALYEALLNAIYTSRKRIWIVTPYFVPDENIVQALIIAQHKGIDVKLITPKHSDNWIADLGRSPYMRELDAIGVDVILYEGEMLHAKAILFDDLGGMVGSVNIDNRSLFLNYEIVTFAYSPHFIESIESWMGELMENSTQGMKKPTKLREGVENMMKVFAPLL